MTGQGSPPPLVRPLSTWTVSEQQNILQHSEPILPELAGLSLPCTDPQAPLPLAPQPPVSGMQLFLRYMSKALSNPGRVAGKRPAAHGVGPAQALLWADD